jgi:hypothetical protein
LTPARTDFAYAQARLQARHGALPDSAFWQVLEASRGAAHFLALARTGALVRWTEGLDDRCDAHAIERQLRLHWRRHVEEVARWLPPRWQAATQWFGVLGELALVDADPARRAQALPMLGLAPFVALGASRRASDTAALWRDEWQRRLPPDHGDLRLLHRPAELLLPRLRAADGARGTDASAAVQATLRLLFRRHAASAVAVFAHLGLVALDVERLRGGLVVRCLFARGGEATALRSA